MAGTPPANGPETIWARKRKVIPSFDAASILDHKIISVATIVNTIRDTGQITGEPSQQAASDLALNLRAGSLPASVEYTDERTVVPSLGADSIRQGMRAGVAGLAAVTVMCAYYKGAGVNATMALALNALILVAALSYFGAVLTLPVRGWCGKRLRDYFDPGAGGERVYFCFCFEGAV